MCVHSVCVRALRVCVRVCCRTERALCIQGCILSLVRLRKEKFKHVCECVTEIGRERVKVRVGVSALN